MTNLTRDQIIMIIIGTVIIYLAYIWYTSTPVENFTPMTQKPSEELNRYYEGSTKGIENHLVDTKRCSKSCCGFGQISYDGLNSEEAERAIKLSVTKNSDGEFVRSNYTCANGIGGVGCPCIDKSTYNFIANHGIQPEHPGEIESTFLLNADKISAYEKMNSPYEQLLSQRSVFARNPKLTDLELGRVANPINDIASVSY